jgi:hypothetical protein
VSKPWRLTTAIGLFFAAVVGIFFAVLWLTSEPPTVNYAAGHQSGQPVNVTLQTVGAYGKGTQPTWVSYLTKSPQGQWVHTTLWQVPAHTRINVTIYNYDSGSPLRNQQIGLVTGEQRQRQSLCGGALLDQVAQPGDQVLVHVAGPGAVPLAVLRALRPGLPLR